MVSLAIAYLVTLRGAGVSQLSPQYPDRKKFLQALRGLPDRAPKSEVLKALGKPDRIERSSPNEETWFYGTDGPTGSATLARFEVYDGRIAYHPASGDPPPTTVISEAELRRGMHLVLDKMPRSYNTTNLDISKWMVKTVNALLPFGEAKCKAIAGECGHIMAGYAQLDACPYFLCYSLFDPPEPPGYFDDHGIVWDAPEPKDRSKTPRWPVEIILNTPVIRGHPLGAFGGYAPSFGTVFDDLRGRIHLRKSPLSAPK